MGITPQALREHLSQALRDKPNAPKRHRERKAQNWTSDGHSAYDPSDEDIKFTAQREKHWRIIGKLVAKGSRIR